LISGCLAAETIDEALRVNNTTRAGLAIYEQRCDEAMGPEMRKSFLYQRVLLNYPKVVDFLIRYMGRHGGVAQSFLSKL
jgi:flavin-dependent dehydrogenase